MNAPLPRSGPAPDLVHVGTYARDVPASLERIWENVLDWEHLPWLHSSTFADLQLEAAGDWGWRAQLGMPGATMPERVELVIDRPGLCYTTRTLEGRFPGAEIRVRLTPKATRQTLVEVGFHLPLPPGVDGSGIGAAYSAAYALLWDEDEEMMCARQRVLDARAAGRDASRRTDMVDLGPLGELEPRLPLSLEVGGRLVRLARSAAGETGLVAFATLCPHALGPLNLDPADAATVVCPWHGYRFDARGGAELGGRPCRLAPGPRVVVGADGNVRLYPLTPD